MSTGPVAGGNPFFRAEYPCTLADARRAAMDVRSFLASAGLSDRELGEWELVVAEAANNAVNYVSDSAKDLPVIVEAAADGLEIVVRIWDHTNGFEMPEAASEPAPDQEGGRGIFIIKELTDSADYLRGRAGNCMALCKARTTPPQLVAPDATAAALEAELALMTEELAASYESLSAIFNFASSLAQSSEPMDLVAPWMAELARVIGADWHAFYGATPDNRELQLLAADDAQVPRAISLGDAGREPRLPAALRAVTQRQDVWFDADIPLSESDPFSTVARGTSGLVHAVFVGSTLIGLAALGREVAEHPFTAGQVNVIHTFADFLGTQVRHAEVQRESTNHQLMRRDLEIAADIQQSLLPDAVPHSPGVGIFGTATSAREVGGDFYDVIALPGGSVLFVIADVMGKGVPAAMFAAILRTLVRSRRDIAMKPGRLLEWVAETVFHDFDRVDMFATMLLVHFDKPGRRVHVAGAGHCPLLVATKSGVVSEVPSEGVPVGILESSRYPETVHAFAPGSRLLLFTDGVTESRCPSGEQWGIARLRSWFGGAPALSPAEIGAGLISTIAAHRGSAPVLDDITFVLLMTE